MSAGDRAELAEAPEVQRWLAGARYDEGPDRDAALDNLAAFCAHTGQAPAELVASCLRTTKDGHTAISTKGRRAMQAAIDQYIAERGLGGHQAVVTGNQIRGFLVHNGVFIQGRASV